MEAPRRSACVLGLPLGLTEPDGAPRVRVLPAYREQRALVSVSLSAASAVRPPLSHSGAPGGPQGGQGALMLPIEALQRLRRLAWRSVEGALLGAFRFLQSCALPRCTVRQQEGQGQTTAAAEAAGCCCCCCSSNIGTKSSSRRKRLMAFTGGPSGCLLSRACLGALGAALVHGGPFVSYEAVRLNPRSLGPLRGPRLPTQMRPLNESPIR